MKTATLSPYALSLLGLMTLLALSASSSGPLLGVEPVRPLEALPHLLALAR